MALEKLITFKGIECNYHKVFAVEVSFNNGSPGEETYVGMTAGVALYKDAAHRAGDVEHYLRLKSYRWLETDQNSPESEKIDKVYDALKELSEFSGAQDV